MNMSVRPYRLVMQYPTFQDKNTSTTLEEALCNANTFFTMVVVCVELMEAVRYLS